MSKTYYLDLLTLLENLSQYQEVTLLHTTIPKSWFGQPGKAWVRFHQQKILECIIETPQGRISGNQAFERLKTCTEWQVVFETPEIVVTSQQKMQSEYTPKSEYTIFQVIQPLSPAIMEKLLAKDRLLVRHVFSTIDGHRSVEQIKGQLNISDEHIDLILQFLVRNSCIAEL